MALFDSAVPALPEQIAYFAQKSSANFRFPPRADLPALEPSVRFYPDHAIASPEGSHLCPAREAGAASTCHTFYNRFPPVSDICLETGNVG